MSDKTEVQTQLYQLPDFANQEFDCFLGKPGELGRGGFGTVRKAKHFKLGIVALKCFPVTGGGDEKKLIARDMAAELELLQTAQHKRILRVHGLTEWPDSMAMVLEYMPGGNLRFFLRRVRNSLKNGLRLRISYEIADGIAFMHNLTPARRLIHGDLKPENVLLTDELHCKLADFGSAALGTYTGYTTETEPFDLQKRAATKAYAAPEKFDVKPGTKPRKEEDIFSYSMIVYSVLTCDTPFSNYDNINAYIYDIVQGKRPPLDTIDRLEQLHSDNQKDTQILSCLKSVMERCWSQAPSERPPMTEIRIELDEILSNVNKTILLQEVADAAKAIKLDAAASESDSYAPLATFNVHTGLFNTGEKQTSISRTTELKFLKENVTKSVREENWTEVNTSQDKYLMQAVSEMDTTMSEEVTELLSHSGSYVDTMLQCNLAAKMYTTLNDENMAAVGLITCVKRLADLIKEMMDDHPIHKPFIKTNVIVIMCDILHQVKNLRRRGEEDQCISESTCLFLIGSSEILIAEYQSAIQSLTPAVSRIEDCLHATAAHIRLYGDCLRLLGFGHTERSEYEAAKHAYQRSIEAYKLARDFGCESDKQKQIDRCQQELAEVETLLAITTMSLVKM